MFWSTAGAVISRGLMLLASIAVARLLGKSAFGEFGMIQSTVGMFGVFAGFGLGLTATKHIAQFRRSDPQRAGRILSLSALVATASGTIMAIGLFLMAPWLAEHTINAPHLAGALRIGAAILFMSALNGAQTGALAGFEAFKTIARVNLVVGLFAFPALVSGTYFGGLTGAVSALAVNHAVGWLMHHIAIRKESARHGVPFVLGHCAKEWRILWTFSLPAVLAGAMTGPVNWACSALLVNETGGYAEMGSYNAANQWFTLLLFLPSTLGSVVLAILSDELGQRNIERSIRTFFLAVRVNLLIALPLAVALTIGSPYIMSLYGEGFSDAWATMAVASLTAVLIAAQIPVGDIIAASGRMWMGFAMNAGWATVFLLSTWLLVHHGSLGLALARAVGYTFHATWTFAFAYRLLRMRTGI